MVKVTWMGGMAFEAEPPSGSRFTMDALHAEGEESRGPSPVETLLSSIAACSAMDVLGILEKKRQKVNSYHVEIEGERIPPGQWPRPFTSIVVRHILAGEKLDPAAVQRAVELSDSKYCSVMATLRATPAITSEWRIDSDGR